MRFLVERFLPGAPEAQLAAVEALATALSPRTGADDSHDVRYLGSTLIPSDQVCFCLFEGPSSDEVKAVNVRAGLAFERVVEAVSVG